MRIEAPSPPIPKDISDEVKLICEASPYLACIINLEGKLEFQNSRCREYKLEDFLQDFTSKDIQLVHSSGKSEWFRMEVTEVKDQQGQPLYRLGSAVTIQGEKVLEETLKAERVLREQFISTLTHDLRNPFSAAKITAQLLARQAHSPEKIKNLSDRIIGSLNRANQMIDNLLDANRIKAGTPLYLEMNEVNCLASIEQALKEVSSVYGERFHLRTDLTELNCHGNGDAIKRMVENLISNAAKYGDEKSKIEVALSVLDKNIKISVHNEGNPIPPAELAEILNPHRKATLAETKKRKGWGLGLVLTKGLVEAHGGTIEVSSSVDAGTTFAFSLPLDARIHSQE